jgi:hypothetical protein
MIIDYGKFEKYTLPANHHLKEIEQNHGAIFYKSRKHGDWYDFQKKVEPQLTYLTVDDNDTVWAAENDITRLNPAGNRVVAVDKIPDEKLGEVRFNHSVVDLKTGKLTITPFEDIA